jgi:hypothetical protein
MTDYHEPLWKQRDEEDRRQMRIVYWNAGIALVIALALLRFVGVI